MKRKVSETRELTDKELNEISRVFGKGVRSQTMVVSGIIQANLNAAFAARRKQASRLLKSKKTVAA